MTPRAWLAGELGSAVVFAIPTLVLTIAGARHVAFYEEAWGVVLYILSVSWFWGPAFLLAAAVVLQSRAQPAGWKMSVLAAVAMSALSVFVLWGFSRQGDVHWSLWAMWIAAGLAAVLTVAGTIALAPSRQR